MLNNLIERNVLHWHKLCYLVNYVQFSYYWFWNWKVSCWWKTASDVTQSTCHMDSSLCIPKKSGTAVMAFTRSPFSTSILFLFPSLFYSAITPSKACVCCIGDCLHNVTETCMLLAATKVFLLTWQTHITNYLLSYQKYFHDIVQRSAGSQA